MVGQVGRSKSVPEWASVRQRDSYEANEEDGERSDRQDGEVQMICR